MSKVSLLIFIASISLNSAFANISIGIQKIAKGNVVEGVAVLEKIFEDSPIVDQAKISLILSRMESVPMENSSIYYAKYALKFLENSLSIEELVALKLELADYNLKIGNLKISKRYYDDALKNNSNLEVVEYIKYRLAWVSFNEGEIVKAKQYLDKVLRSQTEQLRNDSLFLLGKIIIDTKSNLEGYIGKDVLENTFFLKGLSEATGLVNANNTFNDFTKFFYSIHGKIKDTCDVLSHNISLPDLIDIDSKLVSLYLKGCLVKNSSLASNIEKIILLKKWTTVYPEALALSYLVLGEKSKSCLIYREIFKSDRSQVIGLLASCSLEEFDVADVASVKTSCDVDFDSVQIGSTLLDRLMSIEKIENQALIYSGLTQNIEHSGFNLLEKKITSCPSSKNLIAMRSLAKPEELLSRSIDDMYSSTCSENSQQMLSAAYLKYLITNSKVDLDCINKNLNGESKNIILSKLDFSKNLKKTCDFDFDCLILKFSRYVNEDSPLENVKGSKSLRNYTFRINKLQEVRKEIRSKVSITSIEDIYSKINKIKKAFVKPAFFNRLFIEKISTQYNQAIEDVLSQVENLNELDSSQKTILKTAFLNEKVVI